MANRPNLKSLSLNLGYARGFPVDREGNERKALDDYYDKNTFPKSIVVNGKSKKVRWDRTTNKPYNEKQAKLQVNLKLYKTKTPDKDYKYLSKKAEIEKKTETGPAGWRKALSFKSDGETVVEQEHRQWLKRQTKGLESLKVGTSFADSELESQKAKLKQNVSTVEIGTINDKLAKQKFNRNLLSDSDAQLVSDSFNMSQSITGGDRLEGIGLGKGKWPGPANAEDLKFNTSGESISGAEIKEKNGVATVEVPKKSWSDIKGMKRGRERDKLAIEYFKDKGIDLEANTRHKQRDIAKDLYIDNRVFVKDKGWTSIEDVEEGEKSTYHTRDGSGPHRTYSSD